MTKKLDEYTREELIETIKSLKLRKKFGLVWEDKPEKVVDECRVNLPVLQEVTDREVSNGNRATEHLLIEGDNYHSLSVLNYTHAGKVDLIYIDPPYNTGHKDFIYNDDYVDREDTFRHSKWLSFMNSRLELAWKLLNEQTGMIVMSIGEDEYAQLKLLADTLFGEESYVGDAIWQSRKSVSNDTIMSLSHNHTLIYAKDKDEVLRLSKLGLLFRNKVDPSKFSNPDNDPRGPWTADPFDAPEVRANLEYVITNPTTGVEYTPPRGRHWRTTKEEYERLFADNRIAFGKTGRSKPQQKRFLNEIESKGSSLTSIWNDVGTTTEGSKELKKIFGYIPFNNPKPTSLIRKVINACTMTDDATILDFFAGSGTTGHAVLQLNDEDKGSRKFILCTNNENDIADNVTYQRIKRIIEGYDNTEGLAGSMKYFRTTFVPKGKTDDQTRIELVTRSIEMICVRENTFETVLEKPEYRIFSGNDTYATIVFEPSAIPELKTELSRLNTDKPVHIYVFSLSNDTYESDFLDLDMPHELRPIPESILEVYRRIFTELSQNLGV